jgi:uncharacterized hydrophobic protein (TIGR00271 family)
VKIDQTRLLGAFQSIHLGVPAEKRQGIYDSIQSGNRADFEYAALVGLAALIALFGLLQNSAAVIIGAMLISPMMNPLLAGALALLLGDGNLGRRSALVLGGSVAASIALTWFVSFLTPLNRVTPEILARTTPNLLDLFIAFLSGLAGTLALRGGPSSLMILPGVAIAVAVVPPLAVVGYGLSTRQFPIAGGAFLLFLTNLVAIIISLSLVFYSMGYRAHKAAEAGRWKLKYRMAISATVLLILSIPLFLTLRRAVSQLRLQSEIGKRLGAGFGADNASVSDMSLSFQGRELLVHATLRTTKYLDPSQIEAAEQSMRDEFGRGARLQVDQMLVAEGGVQPKPPVPAQNAISGGVVRPVVEKASYDFKSSQISLTEHIQAQLDELLAGSSVRRTAPVDVRMSEVAFLTVGASLASPEPFAPQTVNLLASQLSSKLAEPVQLKGRVTLSGATYHLSFDAKAAARMLAAADRMAVAKVAKILSSSPGLQLQIEYDMQAIQSASATPPPLLRVLRRTLVRAGLKASQFEIGPASPGGGSSSAAHLPPESQTTSEPRQPLAGNSVHYELQVIQTF